MKKRHHNNNNHNNNNQNKSRPKKESTGGSEHDPIAPNMDKRRAKEKALQEEIEKQAKRFKDDQVLTFVRVRFPGNARSIPFLVGNKEVKHGQKVVAMSDRGMAVGYVNSFPYDVPYDISLLPVRYINRLATEEDIEEQRQHYKKEKETELICKDLIEKHKLDMTLTHVEFTQFGKKVVFFFTAPQRVDFRGLVKDLASTLRTQIELRQISLRDRASAVGGIGPCGQQLCCSKFLDDYGACSVKQAKNQNLTINYSKLNGVCGQIKCCISYEDDVYSQKRKHLPEEGKYIRTQTGELGKVERLNLLNETFDILTPKGVLKCFDADMFDKYLKTEEIPDYPERFKNIINETSTVIGAYEAAQRKEAKAKEDHACAKKAGQEFINENFHQYWDDGDGKPEEES